METNESMVKKETVTASVNAAYRVAFIGGGLQIHYSVIDSFSMNGVLIIYLLVSEVVSPIGGIKPCPS